MSKNREKPNLTLVDKLVEEACMDEFHITPKTVKKRVRDKLNENREQRKVYVHYRVAKSGLIAAMIIVLGAASVFAMNAVNVLRDYFSGDISMVQEFIYEPGESIENDQFIVTLEQAISDQYCTLVIYSVEALTDEAEELLEDELFFSEYYAILEFPVGEEVEFRGMTSGDLKEYDSYRKKYYWVQVEGDDLPENSRMRTNILGPDYINESIAVPRINHMESYNIEVNAEVSTFVNRTIYNIGISSIGLRVEVSQLDELHDNIAFVSDLGLEIFFKFKDGSIKTKNELIDYSSGVGNGNETSVEYYYRLKSVLNLDQVESVIVADMEYPLRGGAPKHYEINESLKSRMFIPDVNDEGYLDCSAKRFCEAVGAAYTFDEASGLLTITYRENTLEVVVGSRTCLLNGQERPFESSSDLLLHEFKFVDGELMCSLVIFREFFGIQTFAIAPMYSAPETWRWVIEP